MVACIEKHRAGVLLIVGNKSNAKLECSQKYLKYQMLQFI